MPTMDARVLAHETASWYFSQVNEYAPNSSNVQEHLRKRLVKLTVDVMSRPRVSSEEINPSTVVSTLAGDSKAGLGNPWLPTQSTSNRNCNASDVNSGMLPPRDSDGIDSEDIESSFQLLSRRTKIRMEAFLAGCALAASEVDAKSVQQEPSDLISLQEGLSGFSISPTSSVSPQKSSATSRSTKLMTTMTNRTTPPQKLPQLQKHDLTMRLDIYIRTLQRVKNLTEDCVIAMEPPKVIKARAIVTTNAFVATAGTIRDLRQVLTRLLKCLTMEILAVEVLSEDITKVIKRIVSEYEHGTSFASLAFLSTPEVNADSLLTPLIVRYLKYLQSNWEQLTKNCDLERMLTRALEPEMRKMFKTIEFRSIGHLLETCYEHSTKLQNIELAPTVCAVAENINSLIHSKDALRQAIRDLQREVIAVNGHVLPPVSSRRELLDLLTQTLNSRTMTAAERSREKPLRQSHAKTQESKSPEMRINVSSGNDDGKDGNEGTSHVPVASKAPSTKQSQNEDSDYLFSSEADSGMSDAHDDSSYTEGNATSHQPTRRSRRRNFHVSTIDLLTRRLLIAASRTGNGGDAYFVVRDLFGGEDVEVVPSAVPPLQGRHFRPGTIDIIVRLASVTIKCHQSFDIYPKSSVGECEPLVQFRTTTTETITLQEIRSENTELKLSQSQDVVDGYSTLVLQEQATSRAGWRTISIKPAIYEKVEVWGTPS